MGYNFSCFSDYDDSFYDVITLNSRNQNATQNCDLNEPSAPIRQFSESVSCDYSCISDLSDSLYNDSPPDNILDDSFKSACSDINPPDMFYYSYQNLCDISPPDMFDDSY